MNKIIFPLRRRMKRPEVVDLQDALQLLLDRGLLLAQDEGLRRELSQALRAERVQQTFGGATGQLVARFQEERRLKPSGEVDEPTAVALNDLLEKLGPIGPATTYHVDGRVASRVTPALGGLRVRVVDKAVGGDMPLGEAMTDSRGRYQVSFSEAEILRRGKERPDVQARVFSGEQFLAASEVRYDASTRETLNVLLDDKASTKLGSEHETLTAALSVHHKGSLADLQETDERQDVTYLANKSGWDARAVALAALADQFSARTAAAPKDGRIEPAFFYALFRSGLPANETAIYRTAPATVEGIWKQALKQGVIPSSLSSRLTEAMKQFQKLAASRLLESPALVGMSSFKDLLALSVTDGEGRKQVADLYARHGHEPATFWEQVRGALGEATMQRLKLDGQLAYLTLNNAPLIGKLHAAVGGSGLEDSSQLVAQGFHRAARWREAIGSDPVPPEISGRDDTEKRARYAELLAAQVRLSFPTATVAEMVKSGETPAGAADTRNRVHSFLTQHEGRFEIGMQPVAQYVARNSLKVDGEVTGEITRIQRVYQITPDDESMNGLLRNNIDSAYAVVRYGREEFVRAFRDRVGGEQSARLIHAKAQQVHMAVLNVALTFLSAKGAPGIGVHSPPAIIDPVPSAPANAADVLAYGTLETLFGEMDYCACDHCRSILSPAAYLVDLLLFLDRPASEVPVGFTNPQAVLLERRPDIQHLPLTCENTNTPLPYIDLVNETLEYYITNGLSLSDTDPDLSINTEYTGHNTDGSTRPDELLASPQFVSDAAYAAMAGENFPHPLPFHQPIENLRRYFRRFEAPLTEVMEALRKNDNLDRAGAAEYGWRDIWMEMLGLSRAEHRLLTERWLTGGVTDVMLTVKMLYGFDPGTADVDVRAVVDAAKTFSRRTDITYEQLVEILKTRFINPNSHLIPRLERLGVPFATLKALKDGTITAAEFDAVLAPGLHATQYGGGDDVTPAAAACAAIRAWVSDDANYARIMSLVTLTNPADPENICSFDNVELRYTNPDAGASRLRPFEFIRLIRFIRLWKKLGWSVEQTDKAISALYPPAQAPDDPSDAVNLERLDAGFLALLPSLGVVRRVMDVLKLSPKKDLLSLLACIAPIDTQGENPFYRQMFLSPSQLDEAFAEDGYGNYLTDPAHKVLEHSATLRAAFSLTASEFNEIASALGYDADTALTIDNVSAVFRHGWLARKLKLSVREFLLLIRFTDYDPFEIPDPLGPAILRLVELVGRLRTLGIKPVQVLYLIWNQDLSGKSAPARTEIAAFARTLRASLAAIDGEFARVDDPDGSIARARMTLVYGNPATNLFFGLLENTFVTSVPYDHDAATLAQPILDAAAGRIAYDDFRKLLSFAGVLTTVTANALKAVAGVTLTFRDSVDELYLENQKVIGPFFDRYPELLPLHDAYLGSADPVDVKRTALLEAFLPGLKRLRKRQQALQSVSAAVEANIGVASSLLEDAAAIHAVGDLGRPAVDDLTAMESSGLAARYFYGATAVGDPDLTRDAEAQLEYANAGTNRLPPNADTPGARISGIWSGYLEAPENGFYNVRVDTEATATVVLTLNGAAVTLTQAGGTWSNSTPIELLAGSLNEVSITVENIRDNLAVHWQSAGRGWEVIPAPYLYSATLVQNVQRVCVNLLKASGFAESLKLTTLELQHFAVAADYQIGGEGWLNRLPLEGSPDGATAAGLFGAVVALLDFGRIKAEISAGDERLLQVLRNPETSTADAESLLYILTRWEKPSLDALLARFGKVAADLSHMETLRQIYDAYAWAKRLGVPAEALIEATTNAPTADVVRRLQAALRARYEERAWLEVLRPINDEMRSLQRDALVAFILHRMRSNPVSAHIDTPEKLFEYFLMDVQMDPCMLTSRVRHALSSVQLFVERCLLNLEPSVSPSSIKAGEWGWMKRYRVWEANRKVFIWPENWLEPELRDDQSPFFREAMSELLQGDITEDRAAEAFVGYLTRLEEVAKLEVCGIHYEPNEPGTSDDVAHVIARTSGVRRKYFYRRREYGYWTPWEQVSLDIENNPVLPVVWNNRLFLFWLKLVQEAKQETPPEPTGSLAALEAGSVFPKDDPRLVVKAMLSWSEFLGGKWQPARTSDPAKPLLLADDVNPDEMDAFRSDLRLAALFWPDGGAPTGALRVIVSYKGWKGSSFFLYNSFSTPELREGKKEAHFSPKRSLDTETASLNISYSDNDASHAVLDNGIDDRAIDPHHPMVGNSWDAPFFYEDSRHVFYVTTEERRVSVPEWNDLGILVKTPKATFEIPELVFRPEEILAEPGPYVRQPGFGVVDPSPVERYVTEDAYVRTGIGTPGTVPYGDKNIGPSGSGFRSARTR